MLLPASLLLVSAAGQERERTLDQASTELLRLTELLAREDQQLLERGRTLLEVMAAVPAVAQGSGEECSAFLWDTLTEQPGFNSFGIADANGEVLCSSHRATLASDVSERRFFEEAVERGAFSIGPYRLDRATGRATIHLAEPLVSAEGVIERVAFAALDLDWLNGFAERVSMVQGSQILAWDEEGTVLAAHPDAERWVGVNLIGTPLIESSLSAESGTVSVDRWKGEELLFAFTDVSTALPNDPGLHLGVGVPRELLLAPLLQSARWHLWALWLVASAGALVLLVGTDRWILRPLKRVRAAASDFGQGRLSTRVAPLRAPPEVCALASSFDVMAQTLENNNREREDFINLAAHELKTPLTTLKLRLQRAQSMLEEERRTKRELRSSLSAADRQAWRLAQLVETIIDARTLSGPRMTLHLSRFDLAETVRNVCERLRPSFDAAQTPLIVRAEEPMTGVWDEALVERMLGQLLSNALKFGQARPVLVTLEGSEEEVVLLVRDFGVGIPDPDQERIFERFERGVSSRHHGGLGLGLWIARELALRMGGEIRLTSEPGKGAQFEIRLPRVGVLQDAPAGGRTVADEGAMSLH